MNLYIKIFQTVIFLFSESFFITWFNDWIYIYTKNYNTTFRYNKKKISKHLKLLKFFKFKINLEASWFFINDMVGKMSLLYPLRRRMPPCFYMKLKNNSYALSFCRSYFLTVSVNVWSLLCFLSCSIFFLNFWKFWVRLVTSIKTFIRFYNINFVRTSLIPKVPQKKKTFCKRKKKIALAIDF